MKNLMAAVLLLVVGSAQAAPLTWTLNNVTLRSDLTGENGTLTGSFDYDADTNTYSNLAIDSYEWLDDLDDAEFRAVYNDHEEQADYGSPVSLWGKAQLNDFESSELNLFFDAALTGAGGQVGISQTSYQIGYIEYRAWANVGGTVSAVPIPAAVWLFGSALGGLGWMRRRKTA
jgi:hypothetical protein